MNKVKKGLKALGVSESSPVIPLSLAPGTEPKLDDLMKVIEQRMFIPERVDTGR